MIGPTGVGKTEIARRLAKLAESPFLKVEASKFTEVGYVGRDVESMIRDLMEIGINLVRQEEYEKLRPRAEELAEERLLDILLPTRAHRKVRKVQFSSPEQEPADEVEVAQRTREKFKKMLRNGKLDDRDVEIETQVSSIPVVEVFSPGGMEEMDINLKDMFSSSFRERRSAATSRCPKPCKCWLRKSLPGSSMRTRSPRWPANVSNRRGSSSLTSWTRYPVMPPVPTGPMFRGKGYNGTCCLSSKAPR